VPLDEERGSARSPVGDSDGQENETGGPRREPGHHEPAPSKAFAARESDHDDRQQDENGRPHERRKTRQEAGQGGPA
jgi:hypothetical protein